MYGFLDLETTGLDPKSDLVIEFALAVCDDELEIIAERSDVFPMNSWIREKLDQNEVVDEMHTRNHLQAEMARLVAEGNGMSYGFYKRVLEFDVINWLDKLDIEAGQMEMAGSGVHFDRAFLKEHLPSLEAMFHYRNFDTSTLTRSVSRWAPAYYQRNPLFEQESSHRALSDVHASIEKAKCVRGIYQISEKLWPGSQPSPVVA